MLLIIGKVETDSKYQRDWVPGRVFEERLYHVGDRWEILRNFLLDITELMHGKDGLAYGQSQVKRATTKLLG